MDSGVLLVTALVVILICSGEIPRSECTAETARAVISGRAETVICGSGVLAGLATVTGPDQSEYARIKCVMR
jgi:hypothetical protein